MRNEPETIAIARKVYDFFRSLPYNSEVTTTEGLGHVIEGDIFNRPDLFEIHYALLDIIKKEGVYVADYGENEFACLGLPYNVPFYFRAKQCQGARIYNTLEAVARGEYKFSCSEESRNYAERVVRMVEGMGYDCPVPKRQVVRALDRAFRKGCRIKFEPKPETMERCDGWEYTAVPDLETPVQDMDF